MSKSKSNSLGINIDNIYERGGYTNQKRGSTDNIRKEGMASITKTVIKIDKIDDMGENGD